MRALFGGVLFLFAQASMAVPMTWTFTDAYLSNGAQIAGSFVFDADTPGAGGYDDVSVTVFDDTVFTDFNVPGAATVWSTSDADELTLRCGPGCEPNDWDVYSLNLQFAGALTNSGGNVGLSGGQFSVSYTDPYDPYNDYYYFFDVVSGSVSASVVPIPAAAWLFGSALLGLGWLRRASSA